MLTAQSLTCRHGTRVIFRDASFTLEPGSMLLVAGPNGSGKSSLLRILAGLLTPAEGAILWQNENITADPESHRTRLHYIGHLDALKNELTVSETLSYWKALRNSLPSLREGRGGQVSDPFNVSPLNNHLIRHLSAGQRRRLTLSRLTLDDAPLWLLDEPTTALDAEGQTNLANLIALHRGKGGIVVAAMHNDLNFPSAQNFVMVQAA